MSGGYGTTLVTDTRKDDPSLGMTAPDLGCVGVWGTSRGTHGYTSFYKQFDCVVWSVVHHRQILCVYFDVTLQSPSLLPLKCK